MSLWGGGEGGAPRAARRLVQAARMSGTGRTAFKSAWGLLSDSVSA